MEWLDLVYLATNSEAFGVALLRAYAEETQLVGPEVCVGEGRLGGASPQVMITATALLAALEQEVLGQ